MPSVNTPTIRRLLRVDAGLSLVNSPQPISLSVYVRKSNVVIFFAIILQNGFTIHILNSIVNIKKHVAIFFIWSTGVFTQHISASSEGDNQANRRRC